MRFLSLMLLFVAALFIPGLADAQTVNPSGGSSWDLYVFGNSRVIYEVLMGVKMLMVPDSGSSGFITLLLLLATVGFVVLAVAAGFDPGKNLMKMFSYILVVWMVTLFTTKITANVTIVDLVGGEGNVDGSVVTEVPALVVLPAALTSQVGHYFTKAIETYFSSVESPFRLTSGGAGQFNLFAKMIEESSQYSFRFPEMKQSLASYTANCVVPALALQRLNGPGKEGTLTGVDALLKTNNLMQTYASAKHKALMTTYYPVTSPEYLALNSTPAPAGALGGMGTVVTCEDAYALIKTDMETNAAALLNAGTDAWAKTGIMVPFETAFASMLQQAAGRGGSTYAGFSSPNGFIMQQAFLNTMGGNFRTAALQTGNNELMQAAAMSQAEAQQKSAWVAGFQTFNNMMGYVFTVLQAFIFAITPLIVVALLIPGMGQSIFKNYAQILIWLTLWMPSLAIINFVITVFAGDSSAGVLSMNDGLSWNNAGLFNDKNKNLVIAAQFLGTMVPMLTWGIVRGAMAFTEFISHGVGSQFASSAGASAATGNISMNNASMDNYSANKSNSAFSSAVGFQSVNAFAAAGAMDSVHGVGGQQALKDGSAVSAKNDLSSQLSSRISESKSTRQALENAMSHSSSISDAISYLESQQHSTGNSRAIAHLKSAMQSASMSDGSGSGSSAGTDLSKAEGAGNNRAAGVSVDAGVKASVGGSVFGTGVQAGAGAQVQGNNTTTANSTVGTGAKAGDTVSTKSDATRGQSGQQGVSETETNTGGSSYNSGTSRSHDQKASLDNAVRQSMATEQAYSQALERMQSASQSFSVAQGMTAQGVNDLMSQIDSVYNSMPNEQQMRERMNGLADRVEQGQLSGMSAFAGAQSAITSPTIGNHGVPTTPGGQAPVQSQLDATNAAVDARIKAQTDAQHGQASALGGQVADGMKQHHVSDNPAAAALNKTPGASSLKSAVGDLMK